MTEPAVSDDQPDAQVYELGEQDREQLLEHLRELRRLSAMEASLKEEREKHTAAALPLLRQLGGSLMIQDPLTGNATIAGVREPQKLVCDATDLFRALLEYYDGDVERADAIWQDCLKDREVDTKDDGRLLAARSRHDPENGSFGVPDEVLTEVASFKPIKPHVGWGKPGG